MVRLRKPHPCGGYEWEVTRLGADIGIGTTGVAGPEPDGETPVGEVHVALDGGGKVPDQVLNFTFNQSRTAIKRRAVTQSLMLLRRALTG